MPCTALNLPHSADRALKRGKGAGWLHRRPGDAALQRGGPAPPGAGAADGPAAGEPAGRGGHHRRRAACAGARRGRRSGRHAGVCAYRVQRSVRCLAQRFKSAHFRCVHHGSPGPAAPLSMPSSRRCSSQRRDERGVRLQLTTPHGGTGLSLPTPLNSKEAQALLQGDKSPPKRSALDTCRVAPLVRRSANAVRPTTPQRRCRALGAAPRSRCNTFALQSSQRREWDAARARRAPPPRCRVPPVRRAALVRQRCPARGPAHRNQARRAVLGFAPRSRP